MSLQHEVEIVDGAEREAVLELPPTVRITGRVTLDGKPAVEARVSIRGTNPAAELQITCSVKTIDLGEYSAEVIAGLRYTFEAEAAGGEKIARELEVKGPGEERADLELSSAAK